LNLNIIIHPSALSHDASLIVYSAGDLYSNTRSRLAGQLAQKLLFIKHNLKYV